MNDTKDADLGFVPQPEARPLLTVDVVIFTVREGQLQVLLVRRRDPPFKGMWALPGGFVRLGESLEDAALRELQEETGATDVYLEQLYTFGDAERDPRTHVVSVVYFALIAAEKVRLEAGTDATDTDWHHMYDLPELGFDHDDILDYALTRLRYKLEYSAVAFQLLPEEFTLRELQDVYAVILDNPDLDKRNFRKKLQRNDILEATDRHADTGGRPARLYRFKATTPLEIKTQRLFP